MRSMRDAVSTGTFLSAALTVGLELLADVASAPAPPPVFDAGVALAPVLVLLDVAVEELLLGVVLDELLETSLLDELVPVSVLEGDALVVVLDDQPRPASGQGAANRPHLHHRDRWLTGAL